MFYILFPLNYTNYYNLLYIQTLQVINRLLEYKYIV